MRVLAFLWLFLLAAPAFSQEPEARPCALGYARLVGQATVPDTEVWVPASVFDRLMRKLTETLAGNLATVLRSEWKAKGTFTEANAYVRSLTSSFLTPKTRATVLEGLDPQADEFVPTIARRLYEMEKKGELKPGDKLFVRDPPPVSGATDSTVTYYTKAVRDDEGGKHQVRIRDYVRGLDPMKIRPGQPVDGFTLDGAAVRVERAPGRGPASFRVTKKSAAGETTRKLSAADLRGFLGGLDMLAAPHGKNFKLEIKTRLKDQIDGATYAKLAGQNFVQKLDVSLTPEQVDFLFGGSPVPSAERLRAVKRELLSAPGADAARVEAVFAVLEAGADADPFFLRISGATRYQRSAFEIEVPDQLEGKPVRVQTTVDRDMGVYQGIYGADGQLRPLTELTQKGERLAPLDVSEQAHWELKVPKPLVEKGVGMEARPGGVPVVEAEDEPASAELDAVLQRFSLCRVTNRGKFLHICGQKPIDDAKEP